MHKQRRLLELDGLRGIAAVMVVIYHYFIRYDEIYGHTFKAFPVIEFGKYGVNLFFMISGFVIFWTISKTAKPSGFIWSRFSRLYPVYWAALLITFAVISLCGLPGREISNVDFIYNFLMFHQYFDVKHLDGVYWTLTLELSFYFWMLMLLIFLPFFMSYFFSNILSFFP